MGGLLKRFTSMNFGILTIVVCCIYFFVMDWIPVAVRIPLRNIILTVLWLNIIICIVSRCSKVKEFTVKKAGSFLLHIGIAIIIPAVFFSGQGYTAHVLLKEHETLDMAQKGFPFTIRADEIKAEYYPSGLAKQYFTTISILEQDMVVETSTVAVNHPVRYKGIKIYQSTYELTEQGAITGLSVKTDRQMIFAWIGLALLFAGTILTFIVSR